MRRFLGVGRAVLIGLALLWVLAPLAWLFVTSIKLPSELFQDPPVLIPSAATFEHYRELLTSPSFLQPAVNSLIIAGVATVTSTVLGAMAAYSLARWRLPWRLNGVLAGWFFLTRMYPAISTAIPYFLLKKTFGLLDTCWALILTSVPPAPRPASGRLPNRQARRRPLGRGDR